MQPIFISYRRQDDPNDYTRLEIATALAAGADGMSLTGTYHDPATGESGQVALRRVR